MNRLKEFQKSLQHNNQMEDISTELLESPSINSNNSNVIQEKIEITNSQIPEGISLPLTFLFYLRNSL